MLSTEASQKKSRSSDWTAQQLRLTIFPHGSRTVNIEEWWQAIVGAPPDVVNARPKLNQFLMESTYGLGKLTLRLIPNRVDWLYQVLADSENGSDDFVSSLGKFESALDVFTNITDKWFALDPIPEANRIALGAVLEIPVADRAEAYKVLSDFLPHIGLDENTSEFLYQINRHRHTQINGERLRINRLSKWLARVASQESLVVDATSIIHSSEVKSMASYLELDINSQQDYQGVMSNQVQKEILSKLVELGLEIAEKGDIP